MSITSRRSAIEYCSITTSDVGAQRALQAVANAAGHPPPPLDVFPVLVHAFLFLPADLSALFAVSHTCRAWRLASSALPQWSLLPSVYLAFDASNERNYIAIATYMRAEERRLADEASTRDEVMQFATATRDGLRALRREVYNGGNARVACLQMYSSLTVLVALAALFSLAFALGSTIHSLKDDTSIGLIYLVAGFVAMIVLGAVALFPHADSDYSPRDEAVAKRFTAAHTPFIALLVVSFATLGTPFSLLSARMGTAWGLRDGGYLVYGPPADSEPCRLPPSGLRVPGTPPTYIRVADVATWQLQPYLSANSTTYNRTVLSMCGVTPSKTSWWADFYLQYRGAWENFTCYDKPPDGELRVVYLLPPSDGSVCAGAGPIAIPFVPRSDAFRSSVQSLWSSHATRSPRGAVTWFRTSVYRLWFNVEGANSTNHWWADANTLWTLPDSGYNATRVPLMTLGSALSPDALVEKWWRRFWTPVIVSAVLYVLAVAAIVVSWVRVSPFWSDLYAGVVAFVGLNPLWCLGFGVYCALQSDLDGDTCLITSGSAWALVASGILVTVFLACVGGCFCLASEDDD